MTHKHLIVFVKTLLFAILCFFWWLTFDKQEPSYIFLHLSFSPFSCFLLTGWAWRTAILLFGWLNLKYLNNYYKDCYYMLLRHLRSPEDEACRSANFSLVPPWHFVFFFAKCLDNFWMTCHEIQNLWTKRNNFVIKMSFSTKNFLRTLWHSQCAYFL